MNRKLTILLSIMILITSLNIYKIMIVPAISNREFFTGEKDEIYYDDFTKKIEDINLLLDNSISGFVYVGRDTCPTCLKLNIAILEKVQNDNKLEIYKFDTDFWREDEAYQTVIDKYSIAEVPLLIKIDHYGAVLKSLTLEDADSEKLSIKLESFFYGNGI